MAILGEKGLSGYVKYFLDILLIGGIGLLISLPFSVKWYLTKMFLGTSEDYYFLLGFLFSTGILGLVIINEIRRIFKTLNRKNPFMMDNVRSLKRIAGASFIIAALYILKIVFYNSFLTIILMMAFVIAGFFSIIFAEVFRQAVIVKEENDLTI